MQFVGSARADFYSNRNTTNNGFCQLTEYETAFLGVNFISKVLKLLGKRSHILWVIHFLENICMSRHFKSLLNVQYDNELTAKNCMLMKPRGGESVQK